MVKIQGLDFSYGVRKVLHSISLEIHEGQFFGLLGPNGGGKTTLFRILSTLVKPDEGIVFVRGIDLAKDPGRVRKDLGVVFQHPSIDPKLTAEENLRYQGYMYGLRGAALKSIVIERLNEFGLLERATDRVDTFSGGMQRRLEIAKSLLHQPKLLLLDEPSTGLDPAARRDLWSLLHELKKKWSLTVLFTTHILEEAESCDEIAILHQGKLVAKGSPASLRKDVTEDSIWVKTAKPEELARRMNAKFNVPAQHVDGRIRLQKADGHRFMSQLMEAFPSEIEEIHLMRPNLNDVFFQKTGQEFQ
jgi:ABC-2 type transport system ATP-binding protein